MNEFTVDESVVEEISNSIQDGMISPEWTEAEMDFLSDLFDVTTRIEG